MGYEEEEEHVSSSQRVGEWEREMTAKRRETVKRLMAIWGLWTSSILVGGSKEARAPPRKKKCGRTSSTMNTKSIK